jgi:hypothetical protein
MSSVTWLTNHCRVCAERGDRPKCPRHCTCPKAAPASQAFGTLRSSLAAMTELEPNLRLVKR